MDNSYVLNVYNTCTGRYEDVPVTKEVYAVYKRTGWNLEDDDKRFHKFQSTETELIGSNGLNNFHEVIEASERNYEEDDYEDASEERIRFVRKALDTLRKSDKEIITAIFYDDMTELEVAKERHVSRQCIHTHKKRILARLRKKILSFYAENGCFFETSSHYK